MPAALLLSSCATLGFEILLTRVFAIALWHHLAAMVVSIAMLGFAASGIVLAALARAGNRPPQPRPAFFVLLSASMAAGYLIVTRIPFDPARLSWDRWQLLHLGLHCLVLATPFFFAGLILASAFAAGGDRAGVLYGADLVGAALGSLLAILIQLRLSPEQTIFLFAAAPLGGALLVGSGAVRLLAAALGLAWLAVAALRPAAIEMRFYPSKELPTLLRFSGAQSLRTVHSPYGRIDLFLSPGVRYAPGLSLRYRGELPAQVGIAVDGGAITTATVSSASGDRGFVSFLPSALPYLLRPQATVFLVDPKGGLPWLVARELGARQVDCAETNPALARAVADLLGPARAPCGGKVAVGFGRNVVRGTPGRYDVIDLPLTGSLPLAAYGAGEDYALTVEAFQDYLGGLRPEGMLVVNLYLQPPYRAELRLFNVALRALEGLGIPDPARHMAAVRSLETLTLIVKRTPLADRELGAIRDFARERWFDPVWLPGIRPGEPGVHIRSHGQDLAGAYAALADPHLRRAFVRDYLFDISPATDERPFFHFALRLDRVGEIYALVQKRWDFFVFEGYLLPAVLAQVALLGLLVIGAPALLAGPRGVGAQPRVLVWFSALGAGFMCVEIALIQRLILPLEQPLTAMSLVIGTILVGSGLGSLAGQRAVRPAPDRAALAVALAAAAAALLNGPLLSLAAGRPMPARIAILALLLLPLGFLMGLPFSWGMRVLHARAPQLIPWAWAVNGFFSVLAPLAAVLLATKIGFSAILGLGAACYAAAAIAARPLTAAAPPPPAART